MQCWLPTVLCFLKGVEAQLVRWFALLGVAWPRAAGDPAVVGASAAWLGRVRPHQRRDLRHVSLSDDLVFRMVVNFGWQVGVSMNSTLCNANVPLIGCCACSTPRR